MSFIKQLHRLFSHTSSNLLLSSSPTRPVATARMISPFVSHRSRLHTVVTTYKLHPSQSESDSSDETDMDSPDGFSPKAWLKSGRTDPCVLKEENEVVKAKADLPGIGRDDIKVWIENFNHIRFEATEKVKSYDEDEEDDEPRSYYGAIDVPEGPYKLDEVRAEMKNGVLEIVIPKLDIKERKDVRFISVD